MTLTLKAQNNQGAFDVVMRHLARQPGQSLGPKGTCVYVGTGEIQPGERFRCGAGALFAEDDDTVLAELRWTDDIGSRDFNDGADWPALLHGNRPSHPDPFVVADGVDSQLVLELQALHDWRPNWLAPDYTKFSNWGQARAIASSFELSDAVIDEITNAG